MQVDSGWRADDIPNGLKVLSAVGSILSCVATSQVIHALEDNPNVIRVEASR